MNFRFSWLCRRVFPKRDGLFLAFFWIAGLVFGCLAAPDIALDTHHVIHAINSGVNFFLILIGRSLPIVCIAILVRLKFLRGIYAVCFIRLLCFGYVASAVSTAYGSAGWLVNSILLLPSVIVLPQFFFLCLSNLVSSAEKEYSDFIMIGITVIVVTMLDLFVIAPFLKTILV